MLFGGRYGGGDYNDCSQICCLASLVGLKKGREFKEMVHRQLYIV